MDKNKTYIYDLTEVKWTGRKASKKRERTYGIGLKILYEITPNDPENGTWKKWVEKEDLYKIEEE